MHPLNASRPVERVRATCSGLPYVLGAPCRVTTRGVLLGQWGHLRRHDGFWTLSGRTGTLGRACKRTGLQIHNNRTAWNLSTLPCGGLWEKRRHFFMRTILNLSENYAICAE
jgi:hypothetical protein